MSGEWHEATLSDVCEFHNGLWKGQKGPFVNVGVIRNTNFTKDGALDDSDIAYLDVEVKKFEKRRLQFGDIILEKSGGGPKQAVGRVAFFDKRSGDFSFSNFTSAIRVRDREMLAAEYLHRFLYWQYLSGVTEKMQSHSTGIRNLNGDAYKAIKIRFPDVREQQRIVAILDEAFAGIAIAKGNVEKCLSSARGVFASELASSFIADDRTRSVVMSELFDVGSSKRVLKSEWKTSGVPFYRGREVTRLSARGTVENELFISERHFDELKKRYGVPSAGDIVITAIGTIGNTHIVRESDRFYFKDASVLWLKKISSVMSEFVNYWLKSACFLDQLDRGNGATVDTLTIQKLASVRLDIPSLQQQKSIVKKLDELRDETRRLESLYTRKLAALDELKQSLLQQAFSGNL